MPSCPSLAWWRQRGKFHAKVHDLLTCSSRDFFWPAAKTFAKRVSEEAGAWRMAKRWCSRWARPKGIDKAQKRYWAWTRSWHQSSSAIALVLCSSYSMVRALNSCSCWGPKRTPSALKVVDMICSRLGLGGGGRMREPTIITLASSCSSIQATAIQPTFFMDS